MKRKFKKIIVVLTICMISLFSVFVGGCSMTETIKQKIDQLRCEHTFATKIAKNATCTSVGELTLSCTICGIEESQEIPKTEHYSVSLKGQAPTCSEGGYTEEIICLVCETVLQESVPLSALGHSIIEDTAISPTCVKTGMTKGYHCDRCNEILVEQQQISALNHSFEIVYDENDHWEECSACGAVSETEAHDYEDCEFGSDTENHWGYCTVCGATGPTEAHDYEGCKFGSDTENHWGYCTVCGEKGETEEHDYEDCEFGSDTENHWGYCTVCGVAGEVEEHIWDDDSDTECICGYVRELTN